MRIESPNRRRTLGLLGAMCVGSTTSVAQTSIVKPMRLVASASPGSGVDSFGRILANALAEAGITAAVDNRAGAGGTLAIRAVHAAEPDGLTVLVNSSAHVVTPAMYPDLGIDVLRDFSGVTPIAVLPNVLVISAQSKWTKLADLVSDARARPGDYTFGSAGMGTATHLSGERFRVRTGINALHAPYKGSNEAVTDVIAGRLDWMFAPLSTALPLIRDGRLRALAIGNPQRSAQLSNVPTVGEAGWPGADFIFWVGLFVPAKTPRTVVTRLQAMVVRVLDSPAVRQKFESLGAAPFLMEPEAFDAFLRKEVALTTELVKVAGIQRS